MFVIHNVFPDMNLVYYDDYIAIPYFTRPYVSKLHQLFIDTNIKTSTRSSIIRVLV